MELFQKTSVYIHRNIKLYQKGGHPMKKTHTRIFAALMAAHAVGYAIYALCNKQAVLIAGTYQPLMCPVADAHRDVHSFVS